MKKFLFTLFTLSSFLAVCQNISGEATYKSATTFDLKMDSSKVAADQQAMIKQMMAKSMQKEFTLSFTRTESVFKENESLEKSRGMRMGGMMAMIIGAGGTLYKNIPEEIMLEQKEFFSKVFLISDTVPQYNWKLEKETKSIGKYTCFKATADKIVKRLTVQTKGEEATDTTTSDTVKLVAWYTMQIPVSNGPAKYGGLPGLIMEVKDGNTTMLCTKVILNPADGVSIEKPDSGEEVTQQEFEEITEKKIQEMRKMYRGRGGRGDRGHNRFEITIGG